MSLQSSSEEIAQVTHAELAQNDLAPNFTLPCATFSNTSLGLLTEQAKVLIVFCPACYHGDDETGATMVLKQLQARWDQLQAANVNVVAIARELPFVTEQWATDLQLSFPILSDPKLEVSAQFVGTFDIGAFLKKTGVTPDLGVCITCRPGVVLVDKTRVIRAIHLAANGDDDVDIDFRKLDLEEIIQSAMDLQEVTA